MPSQPRYAPVRPNGLRALAPADGELQTEPRGRAAAPRLRPHGCASMCPRQLVPSAASGRAGMKLGVKIVIVNASTDAEIKEAFSEAVQRGVDAMLVHVDALFNDLGEYQIADLAAQYRLPTMMANHTFTGRGGLISYGADTDDLNRQAGVYIGRILRGEKPADLPVVQPTTFALRVNLKTAKALGLSIPDAFLLLADEVIE